MNTPITGLHHVTAIASDPQRNIDFYAGLLGLRMVKRTVNFDDPSAYHLYYGDEAGSPGSIVTFFYWPGHAARGRIGPGQSVAMVFSAAPDALEFWQRRLALQNVDTSGLTRLGERALRFADPDGIPLEIVAVENDPRLGWTGSGIDAAFALRGFHTTTLAARAAGPTESVLTETMGYRLLAREGDRARFEIGAGGSGRYVDVVADAAGRPGASGAGTVHHVAWSVPDRASQDFMRERVAQAGLGVSPVIDRDYFHSIYFREPGGILFEIATAAPGFAVDEPSDALGESLRLPKAFESARAAIEARLPPLRAAAQIR